MMTFMTTDDVTKVTAYYAQQLSVNSWKIAGTVQTGQGQVMAATKDGRNMSVTVAEHLEYAKKLGDLSENAEYHQARN
jgi:hypothetical protein